MLADRFARLTRPVCVFILFLTLAACASARLPAQSTAPAADLPDEAARREVLAVVERLFTSMATKDTALMRGTFEPGARLVGMRRRNDGSTVLQVLPWQRFAAAVVGDTVRARWTERALGTPEVRVRGTLATVWAHYSFHFGETPSHCGVDAVQLLRTADGWKIVSIADTFEATGCPWQAEGR
jgi:hypothetical protein